jgi:hypothetical protein
MASADGRGHYKASLPANRLPPFLCIHQKQVQDAEGLMLACLIVTPFQQDHQGLTAQQAQIVEVAQAQLIGDHLAGRFPGNANSIWLDIVTGKSTPLHIPNDAWLQRRMLDYITLTLRVPQAKPGLDEFGH